MATRAQSTSKTHKRNTSPKDCAAVYEYSYAVDLGRIVVCLHLETSVAMVVLIVIIVDESQLVHLRTWLPVPGSQLVALALVAEDKLTLSLASRNRSISGTGSKVDTASVLKRLKVKSTSSFNPLTSNIAPAVDIWQT